MIYCKEDYPEIDSHHDIILSSVTIPAAACPYSTPEDLVSAPIFQHKRQKILWSSEGIAKYEDEVAAKLSECRIKWLNPLSRTSIAILLCQTNSILSTAAMATNKYLDLHKTTVSKSERKPNEIKILEANLRRAH